MPQNEMATIDLTFINSFLSHLKAHFVCKDQNLENNIIPISLLTGHYLDDTHWSWLVENILSEEVVSSSSANQYDYFLLKN